jgi:hypothetical protein
MDSPDHRGRLPQSSEAALLRRHFLRQLAATSIVGILWPSLADATEELWEEGDPLCGVPYYKQLSEPNGYQLDLAFLDSFVDLSESLTGVARLDRHLANELMERYATSSQLTQNLNLIIQAYRKLPASGQRPSDDLIKQQIMMSQDAGVRAGAKQLIYLWYISAFYLPIDPNPDSSKPLQDDPTDQRKRAWVYGTSEQYGRALVWGIIRAHAPMTPGGAPGYWAHAPAIV